MRLFVVDQNGHRFCLDVLRETTVGAVKELIEVSKTLRRLAAQREAHLFLTVDKEDRDNYRSAVKADLQESKPLITPRKLSYASPAPASTLRTSVTQNRYRKSNYRAPPTSTKKHAPSAPLQTYLGKAAPMVITSTPAFKHTPSVSINDRDAETSSNVGEPNPPSSARQHANQPNKYNAPTTSIAEGSQSVPNYQASASNRSSNYPPVYQQTPRNKSNARFSNAAQPTQQSAASQNNIQANAYRATLQHQNLHSVAKKGATMTSMANGRPPAYQHTASNNTAIGDGDDTSQQHSRTQRSSEPDSGRPTINDEIAQPVPNFNTAATVTSLPIAYPPGYQRTPRARTAYNAENSSAPGVHTATSRLEPRVVKPPNNHNDNPAFVRTTLKQNSQVGGNVTRQRFLPGSAIPRTISSDDNDIDAISSRATANVSAGVRYEHANIARESIDTLSSSPANHRLRNPPRANGLSMQQTAINATHGVNGSGLSKVQQEMLPNELSDWSTGQAIRWLDSLGRIYQQYEQTFSDNEVDGAMLKLIAQCGVGDARGLEVLEALGVTNRAHQWKIQTHLDVILHKNDVASSPMVDKQEISEQPHPSRQRESGRQTQVRRGSAADLEASDIANEGVSAAGMEEADPEPTHICRLHKEKCHWYCLKCNEVACNFCEMYGPHKQSDGHQCVLVCDAYPEQRERLASDRRFLNVYQGDALAHVALLERHHTTLKANLKSQEAAIKGFCDQARAAIKTREQHLLAKLREMSGRETRQTENQLSTMQRHAESCRVALKMSNTALGPEEPRNVFTGKMKAPASHGAGTTNNKASGDVMQLLLARKPVAETVQTLRFSVLPKPPYALEQEQLVRFKQGLALKRLGQVVGMCGSVVGPSPDQVNLSPPSKIAKPNSQTEQKESLSASVPRGSDAPTEDTNVASTPALAFSPRKRMMRTAASSRSRHTRRSPSSRHQKPLVVKSQQQHQQKQQKQQKKTPEEPVQMQPSTPAKEWEQRQREQVQRERRFSQEKKQYRKHQRLAQSGSMFRTSSPNKRTDALESQQQRRRQNLRMRERVIVQEEQLKKQNRHLRMKQEENEQLKEQLQQQQQHTIRALEKSSTPMFSTGYRSVARTSAIAGTSALLHAPAVKPPPSRAKGSPRRRHRVDGGSRNSSREVVMGAATMQESVTLKSLASQIRSPAKQVMAVDAANIPSSLHSPSQQQLVTMHTPTRSYSPTRNAPTEALTREDLMKTPTRGHSSPRLHAQLTRLRTELAQQQQQSLVQSQRQDRDLLSSEIKQQQQQQQYQQRRQHLEEELELQQRQQKRRHKKIELKQRQQDREDEEDRRREQEERLQQTQIQKLRRKEQQTLLRQQLNHQELRLHHHEMKLRESQQQKQRHHHHYLSHHEKERKRLQIQEEQLLLQQRKQKLHRREQQQKEQRKELDHTLAQQEQRLQQHELKRQEHTQRQQQYENDQRLRLEETKQREEQQTRTQLKRMAQHRQHQRQLQQQLEEERENQQERQRQRELQQQRLQQEQDLKWQQKLRQDLQQQQRARDAQQRERFQAANARVQNDNAQRRTLSSALPAGSIPTSTPKNDEEYFENSRLDISYLSRTELDSGASTDEDMPRDVNLDGRDGAAGTAERRGRFGPDNARAAEVVSSAPSRRARSAGHHVATGLRSNAPFAQSPYLKHSRGAIQKTATMPPAPTIAKGADWSRAQTPSAVDMASHRPAHALPTLSNAASIAYPRHRPANPHLGPAVSAPSLGDMEDDVGWEDEQFYQEAVRRQVQAARQVAGGKASPFVQSPPSQPNYEADGALRRRGYVPRKRDPPLERSKQRFDDDTLQHHDRLHPGGAIAEDPEDFRVDNVAEAKKVVNQINDALLATLRKSAANEKPALDVVFVTDDEAEEAHETGGGSENGNLQPSSRSTEEKNQEVQDGANTRDSDAGRGHFEHDDATPVEQHPTMEAYPVSEDSDGDDGSTDAEEDESSVDAISGSSTESLSPISRHTEYARDPETEGDAGAREQLNEGEGERTGVNTGYAEKKDEIADYHKLEEAMDDGDDDDDMEEKSARLGDRQVVDYHDVDCGGEERGFEGDVAGHGVDVGMDETGDHGDVVGENGNEFNDFDSDEQDEQVGDDGHVFIVESNAGHPHGADDRATVPQLNARNQVDYSVARSNESVNQVMIDSPPNEDQTLATAIIDQVLNNDGDDDLDQSDDSDHSVY